MAETIFADELLDNVRLSLISGVGPLLRKARLERFVLPTRLGHVKLVLEDVLAAMDASE